MASRYHDDYVRTPEGWRISRRITRFAYVTPLSEGCAPERSRRSWRSADRMLPTGE
jgi:hypothetical protein